MPRVKGMVYDDDPFCPHGYDEGCPECDASPSELAAGIVTLCQTPFSGRRHKRPRSYQEWVDRNVPPVDDGAADNHGGW